MLIHVTQSHIDRGCRCDGENCPVKIAIREQTGIPCIVAEDYITFGLGVVDTFQIATPFVVKKWIIAYDRGSHVLPFEFELDVEGV